MENIFAWIKKKRRILISTVVVVAICGVWAGLSQVTLWPGVHGPVFLGLDGVLGFLEQRTVDARFAVRGDLPTPLKVGYVDVDGDALQSLGNFPWNRAIFAGVIDALFERGGVRGIGFDFVFSNAGLPNLGRQEAEEGSLALGRSIQRHGAVVLAASYSSGQRVTGSGTGFPFVFDPRMDPAGGDIPELPGFPVVGPTWGRVGLIDVVGDDVRAVPMFAQAQGQTYWAMALQLALLHYGLPASSAEIGKDAVVLRKEDGGEAVQIPLRLGQLVEPNWFSPWYAAQNPRAGVVSVLEFARLAEEGTVEEKAQAAKFFAAFKDAIVLVGPTDPMLKDMAFVPLNGGQSAPRVSLHGNLLKTIVGGRFIQRLPWWGNVFLILLLGGAVPVLSVLPPEILRGGKGYALGLALAYVVVAFGVFAWADILLPVVAPLGAAASCTLFSVLTRLATEERRRRRIKMLFGSYVSASVVEEIVGREGMPQTGGEEVEITAFFSDIASFSSLSEKLEPKDLVALMCEYLEEGTAAISAAGGTLDKYVGDAIIAMFGVPLRREDHAAAACRAALAVQEGQKRLCRIWALKEDGGWPAEALRMRTRVGLNTGRAVVGNIGGGLRFNYTMMGDTVNLAQRMESAVGHFGADILVTEATMQAAFEQDPTLVFRPLDCIHVAGHKAAVEVYELLGGGEGARAVHAARLASYKAARDLYREARWAEAVEAFMSAARHEPGTERKNPCVVMASRCETFAKAGKEKASAFVIGKG